LTQLIPENDLHFHIYLAPLVHCCKYTFILRAHTWWPAHKL